MSRFLSFKNSERDSLALSPLLRGAQRQPTYHTIDDNKNYLKNLNSLKLLLEKELAQQSRCYNRLSTKHKIYLFLLSSLTALGTGGIILFKVLVQESNNAIRDWNRTLTGAGSNTTCAEAYNDIVKCHFQGDGDIDDIKIIGESRVNSPACYDIIFYLCRLSCEKLCRLTCSESFVSPKDCKGLSIESYFLIGVGFAVVIIAASVLLTVIGTNCLPSNAKRTFDFFFDHRCLMREAKITKEEADDLGEILCKTEAAIAQLQ